TAQRRSSEAPRSTLAAPINIPHSITGTITSEAARPIPGTSSSASLLSSVKAPSAHQSQGARLNSRIAPSNHAKTRAAATGRGTNAAGEDGASIAGSGGGGGRSFRPPRPDRLRAPSDPKAASARRRAA